MDLVSKVMTACAVLMEFAVAAPTIWDGTADVSWYTSSAQAYNLTTAEQLAGLAKLVNQGTSSFEGKTITLGADIFLNDTAGADAGTWASVSHTEWVPIGTSTRPFKGEFDGIAGKKNRKIYGLYVSDATKDYVGLFGYTSNVKISNLDVLVGRITAKDNVGALVGYAVGGSLTNVHSEVKVTGNNHVGGLVGYFTGTLSTSSVKENVTGQDSVGGLIGITTGSVSGTAKAKSYFVGNVAGRISVGGIVGAGSSITHSYADGIVKGDSSYVGGVAGRATGNMDSTYHTGGDVSGASYVGGLIGQTTSSVKKSYSEGNVTGTSSYVGGLVGYGVSVDSSNHTKGDVNGTGYVGGLIGQVSSSVTNSYSEGDVTGTENYVGGLIGLSYYSYSGSSDATIMTAQNSYATGNVTGKGYVGGLIGLDSIYRSSSNTKALVKKISNSHSVGNVIGKDKYVGGVIGKSNYGYYSSSYNTNISLQMSSSYHKGSVEGASDYVGGVAGFASGSISSSYHIDGDVSGAGYVGGLIGHATSVSNSYSEGSVTGTSDYVGGLVGYGSSVASSNHTKGDVSGYNYVGGLAGQTTSSVSNSYSEGNVTGTGNYIGGLIGRGYLKTSNGDTTYIRNSYSIGDVEGVNYVGGLVGFDYIYNSAEYLKPIVRIFSKNSSKGFVKGNSYIGGLVGAQNADGRNPYAYQNVESVTFNVQASHHTEGGVFGKGSYIGGLIGYINGSRSGSIDSSYHIGGDVSGSDYVGGLVGRSTSSVSNSYSEGNVTGISNYVGGLIGLSYYRHSDLSDTTIMTPQNSYAIGNVKGKGYVGGLIGLDTVYSSSNTKTLVKKISNSHSVGNVIGKDKYVGGVIGKSGCNSSSYKISLQIFSSYHKGSVKGDSSYVGGVAGYVRGNIDSTYHNDGNVSGYGYVGGLAGQTTSSVSNSYSEGGVTGTDNYIGGLVGYGSSISKSYAEGSIKSDSSYVGGIAGYVTENIDSTYHIGGDVSGAGYVGGLIGQTTSSVKHSYSEGSVTGTGNYIGGLVGRGASVVSSNHTNGDVSSESNYIGGLIGYASGAVDSSFHMGGDISGSGFIGGLVGATNSGVKNSHSEGNVTGTNNNVGGLIGSVSGTVRSASNSIDSSNHTGGDVSGSSYVGGLVGGTCSFVTNSYSEGDVTGTSNRVGGVVGSALGKIRNSYAVAKHVRGLNLVGGLAGYVEDSIDVSYFEGDSVTGIYQIGGLAGYAEKTVDSSYSTAHVKGDDNIGGLIGSAYDNVSNSYAIGNVIGDVENSSAGNDNLGGLVGYQYSGSISKSMALGNVSGTTKLGGLVGRFDGTKISQSYANGNVTGDYYGDPADENGNYYIGGLVGYAKGALEETYASGVVKGIEDEPVYTGCVVGYVNGSLSVSKSYYDKTKCGLGVDGGEETVTVSGSPAKTTAEMQVQETFVDWDFTNTWKIMEGTYPFLQIYSNSLTNAVVTTASLEGIEYDGSAKTPLVTSVTLFGEALEYETEYTITYKDNINAGMATINVCGVKPYGGCNVIEFEIAKIAIEPTIAAIENVTYTGRALTPTIRVYNGASLLAATDYAVEYKDNVNAGTASVTVTLKGNYSGSATKTFTIKKATPVISQNPTASNVINGQTLASSELTGGNADVGGSFVWQAPETVPTLENDGYIAVFVPTDTMNYDSVETTVSVEVLDYVYVAVHVGDETLDSAVVIKGGNYTLPNAPDSVGYDFVGLYKGNAIVGNPGDVIVLNENTVIEAIYEAKTFAITFANGGVVLQSENTAYGTLPEYRGETPTKTATAQYTYTFKGWSPAIASVTAAATYTAVFDSTVNKYTVTFKDGETVLQSGEVAYGTMPTAPAVSLPENTSQYSYSFGGWDSEIVAVTGPATYTAVINRTLNRYGIVFKDYDGSVLKAAVEYDYGTSAASIVKPANPTRGSAAQYTYTFKGWTPSIVDVTGAAVYTAEYDSTVRSYEIAFVNGNSTLQSGMVEYGQTPVYSGEAPTRTATAQYTYTFKGWTPTIASVTGEATYAAVFDSVVNRYLITFKNGSEVIQADSVAYGTVPEKPSITLPMNTAQYTYSLSWDKDIVAVTGEATYTATIDSAVNKYDVVFKDYDGTVLKDSIYAYGTLASKIVEPANLTRAATAKYTFAFKGWSPSVADVTTDAAYTAVYDSTIRSYTIAFVNGSETEQSSEVEYGEMPSYKGSTPTKTATMGYTYTFKGWSPAVTSVSGAATYTAVFDSTIRKYTVTFMNDDVEMQTSSVAYGSTPVYSGKTPTKAASDSCTYKFSGWSSDLKPVTGDVIYTAKFEVVKKTFVVHFVYEKSNYQVMYVAYGDTPKYTGNTPTKNATNSYTYEFVGWSPKLGPVTKETYYTAVFDSAKVTGIQDVRLASLNISVSVTSRNVQISAAPVGSVYAIFDMQGRTLRRGRVDAANFNITLPRAGSYIVRVGSSTRRVDVK